MLYAALMNILLHELEALTQELGPRISGGKVQQWRQPEPASIVCTVRVPGETIHLLLAFGAGEARMHQIATKTGTLNPPPAFLSKVRKELLPARLERLEMPWNDRVVVLHFRGQESDWLLVAEFTGHHPNLFLTSPDFTIVSALRPSASHKRTLTPGSPYTAPLAGAAGTDGLQRLSGEGSTSRQLEQLYQQEIGRQSVALRRNRLLTAIRQATKRTSRTIDKVQRELDNARGTERFRHQGELLKANLHLLRRGMESVELADWGDEGRMVTLELDPAKTPRDNMERYFARYRKGVRALPRVTARLQQLQQGLGTLESLAPEVESGDEEALGELELRAKTAGVKVPAADAPQRGPRKAERHRPERRFVSSSGKTILVGKGGKDNHAVTFQLASPHDLWMHARGFAGSHVVIPLSRGQEPDHELLLDGAHLAVHFSKAPASGFCEVMWTRRKNVRAIPKGAPGKVLVSQDSNLAFQFSADRLSRLLESRDESAPLR